MSPPDALRRALGEVVAHERRQWQRERELIEAQHRAALAEAREECRALLAKVEAALASVRDGRDGRDGVDGAPGRDAPAVTDEQLAAAVAAHLAANPPAPGRDGRDGVDGQNGRDGVDAPPVTPEQLAEAVGAYLQANPPPAGRDGRDGADGRDGKDGRDGTDGAPGRLPVAREWRDAVHYEGDVVTFGGGLFQAVRDTGRDPTHEDWICLASPGRDGADGRSLNIRGTFSADEAYQRLDVVALNGGAFVAKRDDPGTCPGDGWQLIASRGKPGAQGERGLRGEIGPAGPAVVSLDVDGDGVVTLQNADGTRATLDLYPLLSRVVSR